MNAYIASFMLLVFNAVGLAVPAIGAVAEERVATDTKPAETQNSANLTKHGLEVGQADQCLSVPSKRATGFDYGACNNIGLSSLPLFANIENGGTTAILAFLPERSKLADNKHIEGAP